MFKLIAPLMLLAACLLLGACNTQMSYDEASKMEPYKSLSPEERRWLYNFDQTPSGAAAWLEEEIRLQDDAIDKVWFTSDGLIELETKDQKTFSMKREKAIAMVKAKGAPVAAKAIITEAHTKFGGFPSIPETSYLLIGLSADQRHAQKLHYPKLYAAAILGHTQQLVEMAGQFRQANKLPQALKALGEAIRVRKAELGENDPATQGALAIFQEVAGRPYTEADSPTATAAGAAANADDTADTGTTANTGNEEDEE